MTFKTGTTGVLAGILISAVAAPALASPSSFTTEGSCVESLAIVLVDADQAQEEVPEGFVVRDVGGKAPIFAFAENCVMSVDDGEEFATTLSGTGVSLERPSGNFDFTWSSDAGQYFGAYNRLGVGGLIKGSQYEARQVGPGVVHSEAVIPGDFSLTLDSSDATSPIEVSPPPGAHWLHGRLGSVKGTYPHDFRSGAAGAGILQAAPGSPLSRLIGTDPVRAPGAFLRFHFTGTVELADPA